MAKPVKTKPDQRAVGVFRKFTPDLWHMQQQRAEAASAILTTSFGKLIAPPSNREASPPAPKHPPARSTPDEDGAHAVVRPQGGSSARIRSIGQESRSGPTQRPEARRRWRSWCRCLRRA